MGFVDIIPATSSKVWQVEPIFLNYLLIVDAYSKVTKLYVIEMINTGEVMDKLDMFQFRFGKKYEFGWWYLEIISSDAGIQSTSTEFQYKCQTCGVSLILAAPDHKEINRQVEATWRMLHKIVH